jgi:MazG family protein
VSTPGPIAVERLDQLARRLRRECPWDREQDARSIVAHTVDEAYELADAAHSGDDAKLLDELGDVLFQVHFLALLLEERGAGDLAQVAEHCIEKLIRRHPHVFGEVEVDGSEAVRRNWDEIKRSAEGRAGAGIFGELPENLPSLSLAARVQRRAEGAGVAPTLDALAATRDAVSVLAAASGREERFDALGEALFALVRAGRACGVDPELALRAATVRFRATAEAVGAAPGAS